MRARKTKIREMAYISLFVAIISIVSQIAIPMPSAVPITLQIFVVAFSGYFLGLKKGIVAIFLYIAIGAVGAPVFAGFRGGFYVLLGPSGGFIYGFIIVVIICAFCVKTRLAIPAGILSVLACHFMGVLQYAIVAKTTLWISLLTVSLPYVLKDIILVPLAYLLYRKMNRIIKQ